MNKKLNDTLKVIIKKVPKKDFIITFQSVTAQVLSEIVTLFRKNLPNDRDQFIYFLNSKEIHIEGIIKQSKFEETITELFMTKKKRLGNNYNKQTELAWCLCLDNLRKEVKL
jgi:membrane protease subunit (stomatin/prohibitin family)